MHDRIAPHCCYTATDAPEAKCLARRWSDFPMCTKHTYKVLRHAILDGALPTDVMHELVELTGYAFQVARVRPWRQDADLDARRLQAKAKREAGAVVYYVRLTGGRIKIGWSSNLPARLAT